MGNFTTSLKLGGRAYGVSGGLDPTIQLLTVGQVRIVQTHPRSRNWASDVCYVEEYMCDETGVGGGTVWEYGKNIFATEAEAQQGVIAHQQAAYKQRAERDARKAEQDAQKRASDLAALKRLKEQYESAAA